MPDRLAGIAAKIERAEHHIDDLQAEWIAFGRRAYEIWANEEGDRRNYRLRIKEEEIPLLLSCIIGDAVSNLRSALDYLIYQLLDAKGLKVGRHHYFPISASADQFKTSYRGKIEGVGDEAERLIKALKPYKGGTDSFWHLDELCRVDKHRLLITIATRPQALALNIGDIFSAMPSVGSEKSRREMMAKLSDRFLIIHGKKTPCPVLEDGEIVYSEPRGMEPHKHTQLGFVIAFGEGKVLECEPVIGTLRQLLDLVKGTVEPFRPLLI